MRVERHFGTAADRPSAPRRPAEVAGGNGTRWHGRAKSVRHMHPGRTAGDIEQRRAGADAGSNARGAIPVGLHSEVRCGIEPIEHVLLHSEVAQVAFDTDEVPWRDHVVVTGLNPAGEAVAVDVILTDARAQGYRVWRATGPKVRHATAGIETHIEAAPVVI